MAKRRPKTLAECRSDACRKGWATRRKKALARSRAAKRGWATRRAKAARAEREREKRAERARKGHAKRPKVEKLPPAPKFIFIPRPVAPTRAPERLTESQLDAVVASFARRRIHPDEWARDLANQYDLDEVGPLYKAYFAIVSPP